MSNNELVLLRRIEELEKLIQRQPEVGGVWQDWTPTFSTAGGMTYTLDEIREARYATVGKILFFTLTAVLTLTGSYSLEIYFTAPKPRANILPFTYAFSALMYNAGNKVGASGFLGDSKTIRIFRYDNSNYEPGTAALEVSGFYEIK